MILAACLRVGRAKVVKFAKYLPEISNNPHFNRLIYIRLFR